MNGRQNNILTFPSKISFSVGIGAVLFILIFRNFIIHNSSLSQLGSGYISFTSPVINGYNPSIFYRIMHNLTVIWSLILYLFVMNLGMFLISHTSWNYERIKIIYSICAITHIVFVVLFVVSFFLPMGDMVTVLAK